ncbi:hypothetical protein [Haloarcula marina]|uniref:hypothetical protein n=1 Tax=Haloarcula marina TaxID=2961574 RepID=UPI0020B6B396|nr:hypothetical protein [Halomicroarcula marina]
MTSPLIRLLVTLAVLTVTILGVSMPVAAVPLDGDDGDEIGVMPGDNVQIPDGTFLKAKKAFDENVPKTTAWTARDRLFGV